MSWHVEVIPRKTQQMSNYGNYRLENYLREFGFGMFAHTSITRILRTFHAPAGLIDKFDESKWAYVAEWITEHYAYCIRPYDGSSLGLERLSPRSPIWIFWWQGMNEAPRLVRACVDSIVRHAEEHPVHIITKSNYVEYVEIDGHIVDKAERGMISFTHFSDILRFNLMKQRGGFWLDSTLYLTDSLPSISSGCPYFTQPLNFGPGPWTDFLQGSGANNPFTTSVADILNAYILDHEQMLTYLLMDCCMRAVYESSEHYRNMINLVPNVKNDMFALTDALSMPFSIEKWEAIKWSPNFASKLSYKEKYPSEIDGKQTFYGKLLAEGRLPE